MSPTRARSHQLEALSTNRFEQLVIKHGSVFRAGVGSTDYGIDGEVELFQEGSPTGLSFKVQLKASDKVSRNGAYRDIKLDHFNYWNSLSLPVLLVYWSADVDQLYARWVHRFDFGRNFKSDKTHRVRFRDTDVLDAARFSTLVEEVALMRAVAELPPPRPMPLLVEGDLGEEETRSFLTLLGKRIRSLGLADAVQLVHDAVNHPFSAQLTKESMRVATPAGISSISLYTEPSYLSRGNWDQVSYDLLTAVGHLLGRLGHPADSVEILRTTLGHTRMGTLAVVADYAAAALIRQSDPVPALEALVFIYRNADDLGEGLEVLHDVLRDIPHKLSPTHMRRLNSAAKDRIRGDTALGRYQDALRVSLNLASLTEQDEERAFKAALQLMNDLSPTAMMGLLDSMGIDLHEVLAGDSPTESPFIRGLNCPGETSVQANSGPGAEWIRT